MTCSIEEAGRLQEALLNAGNELAREEVRLLGLVGPILQIAEVQGDRRNSSGSAMILDDFCSLRMASSSVICSRRVAISSSWRWVMRIIAAR